eukprot:TRINITY_DN38882_c0_g1_i2.p1 TRINITY_DN38882_c0_g1~~TRINITY_DN38882_c0_g1_i2.p1  ORF type:complete len:409 (-),score=105.27 TRINITY_DN38882_c0_g1_i2:82-1308(-)
MAARLWFTLLALVGGGYAGSKGSVLLTGMPLHGHFVPLQALGLELLHLGYSVTLFSFDELSVMGKAVPVKQFADPKIQLASLGSMPIGFEHKQAQMATLHRQMYGRLGVRGGSAVFDVWVFDGQALGAMAAAEDSSAQIVFFVPFLSSEFMHLVASFGMEEQVSKWPVIVKGTTLFDPPVLEMYPAYPDTFQFIGHDNQSAAVLPEDLLAWLSEQEAGVVYVSLGAVPETPLERIKAISDALTPMSVVWSLPAMHSQAVQSAPPSFWVRDWLPQTGVLAHPNVKAFVSSCGLNSVLEAVSAEVGMVCVPQSAGQLRLARLVSKHGVGSVLQTGSRTAKQLGQHVKEQAELLLRGDSQGLSTALSRLKQSLLQAGGSKQGAAVVEKTIQIKNSVLFEKSSFGYVNSASF